MPSRWERITGVAPKTAADRKYLAFVAARYRGEERLPRPDALAAPDELGLRQRAGFISRWTSATAVAVMIIGFANDQVMVAASRIAVIICALVANIVVSRSTEPAISEFHASKSRCDLAESRLHADLLDPEDSATINKMITCDEGTLTYCAAKIASEIEQNLLGNHRISTSSRSTCGTDTQLRNEALTLLAARVHAFADYRDWVHRHGTAALRESSGLSRAIRLAADEQAINRLL